MTVAYASMSEANAYFATRLHSGLWNATNLTDRTAAILAAARAIDLLNFAGDKTDPDQANEFPRDSDTDIPLAIKEASYEIAFSLIDGVDVDAETDNLGVVSEGYASVRTTYARDLTFEHLAAGIPSPAAWKMLKPFLRDVTGFRMSRVS